MFEQVKHYRFLDPNWKPMHSRFYCGHCIDSTDAGTGWISLASLAAHIQADHFVAIADQEDGYDKLSEDDLLLALRRWRSHNDDLLARFRVWLDSIIGPDDFITDCG